MKIKESFSKNIAILTVSGNMMGGPETVALHEKVRSLVSDGVIRVVIDLKKVKWLNSSGLGVLMSCYGTITRADGTLKLAGATDKVESVMMITKLIKFFETYDNTDKAILAFNKEG